MNKTIIISINLIVLLVLGGIFFANQLKKQNSFATMNEVSSLATQNYRKQPSQQINLFNEDKPAPELTGITQWLNTNQSLTMSGLRGNVVLVDFWTNQCINCIRTLAYVTKWYDTYHNQGFIVIGVHTPELAYEYSVEGINNAIRRYNIHYPVAQDNNYGTWNAYNNEYWPAFYLVDKKGTIRRTHFGEGEYAETEQAIKTLLTENKM